MPEKVHLDPELEDMRHERTKVTKTIDSARDGPAPAAILPARGIKVDSSMTEVLPPCPRPESIN